MGRDFSVGLVVVRISALNGGLMGKNKGKRSVVSYSFDDQNNFVVRKKNADGSNIPLPCNYILNEKKKKKGWKRKELQGGGFSPM